MSFQLQMNLKDELRSIHSLVIHEHSNMRLQAFFKQNNHV